MLDIPPCNMLNIYTSAKSFEIWIQCDRNMYSYMYIISLFTIPLGPARRLGLLMQGVTTFIITYSNYFKIFSTVIFLLSQTGLD